MNDDKLNDALGRSLRAHKVQKHAYCDEKHWLRYPRSDGSKLIICKICGRDGRDVTESKARHYRWAQLGERLRKANARG